MIEIVDNGFGKTYKWFCEGCKNFVNIEEKDIITCKNEHGITKQVLKCSCGEEIAI